MADAMRRVVKCRGAKRRGVKHTSFPEVYRENEGGRARRDMNRCSTREVIVMVGPPFGVPQPACDGIINESGPQKDEDK